MTGPFPDGAPGAFGVFGWVGIVGGGVYVGTLMHGQLGPYWARI
ncbi:hypothetical protein [Gordonia zhenghanii]|nr:hypothetical protein [Gordonia zhenghanii]